MCHLLNWKTTPKESTWFSVLWEHQICIIECCGSTNVRCFFSSLSHVKTNSTLSLSGIENLISFINCYHSLIHFFQFGIINLFFISSIINYISFFIHNSKTLNFFKISFEIHFIRKFVIKEEFSINLTHCTKLSDAAQKSMNVKNEIKIT